MPNIQITPEFQTVLDNINNKVTPMFITGGGGVGKSSLISYIQKNYRNTISVAPTGIAALNINGSTIHSTFRMPPKYITITDKAQLKSNNVISVADILIIDEISMVNANMLDAMDYIIRKSKRNNLPFGGMTVLMFGDLYQLPPVVTDETKKYFDKEYDTPYFFSANCIKKCKLKTIKLTKVFRQKDERFIEALNDIRSGNNIINAIDYINMNAQLTSNDKDAVVVTTTNSKCSNINNLNLRKIKTDEVTFIGEVRGKFNIKSLPVDSIIDLKVGARVIICKNMQNAVNGSIGTITKVGEHGINVKLDDCGSVISVCKAVWENCTYRVSKHTREVEKDVIGSYTQIPVKLAWAITIHKCVHQDTLLTTKKGNVKISDVQVGEYIHSGFGYRKVTNKWVSGMKEAYKLVSGNNELICSKDHQILITYNNDSEYVELGDLLKNYKYCYVTIHESGINHKQLIDSIIKVDDCYMYDIEVDIDHSFVANGIITHNCQGQTLTQVHVDMDSGAFASGQLYVALSRATSVQGITLSRPIYTSDVIVDCDVKQFYEHCE